MVVSHKTVLGTPTADTLPRRFADFETLTEALDYAAEGQRGINFFSARGQLAVQIPYIDLQRQAVTLARRMTAFGLAKGDRVALIAETSADFVIAFLGCQYASVLPVPLPLPTSFGGRDGYVRQLHQQIQSCGAVMLLGPDAMGDLARDAAKDSAIRFVGSLRGFADQVADDGPLRLPQSDDLAYLQYSSGSTRFPHGIAVTHRSLLANCRGQALHGVKLVEDDRNISWLPFYHDMGLVGSLLTPLTNQVSADYLATEDFARRPLEWLRLIDRNRGTISFSPTFGYDICARRFKQSEDFDLSCWRVAGIGGDMIRPDVMRNFCRTFENYGFRTTTFVPSYGLAECTLAVSFAPLSTGIEVDLVDEAVLSGDRSRSRFGSGLSPSGPRALNGHRALHAVNGHNNGNGHSTTRLREIVNCGKPLPEYEVEIRDKAGHELPEREIGRVFVRGQSVMREYYNDADATNQVLGNDGWLDTGDMGYWFKECLYIVGRAKDMIIVNGRNHWPQDIEWAAEQIPGIRSGDIAAISVPGQNAEEIPTVLVQCRLRDTVERTLFAQNIKTKIREATGIVCHIELIPPRTLPRTSSGKLSRSKARAKYLAGGLTALAS